MKKIINIAIIAHVDHGKTTLTDHLLRQGGAFGERDEVVELVMDSNDLERERGITIFSKNCSIKYKDYKINIVDTPGHADFGSEVERVLKMVDSVLLLVDAREGPMPQTKFVLSKSLKLGLRPIVVINKIDKKGHRAHNVVDEVFDLFVKLDATDLQLDFPIVYTISREGIAKHNLEDKSTDLTPLFETILKHVAPYPDKSDKPLQMQVTNLAYDDYVGRIAIGRVLSGKLNKGANIAVCKRDGSVIPGKITKLHIFDGLKQVELNEADCGDIVSVAGMPDITIGETITAAEDPRPLPLLVIDEPTLTMEFIVNNSPFAGREGKFVTTRQIKERLERELETNVGLRLEPLENGEGFKVSGRGELHLSILLEEMRRENYEVQVSQPKVIFKTINNEKMEPMEQAIIQVPEQFAGTVIEKLGKRRGEMLDMGNKNGTTTLTYMVPTRGLLGFRAEFIMDTKGEGILNHAFAKYERFKGEIAQRQNGVLISGNTGKTASYALDNLQQRARLFVKPGIEVYEGMIVGENSRAMDMTVNPCKEKKQTNIRAASADEAIRLTPPIILTLEQALEFIDDDELVEITPKNIRLRKKYLTENERDRNR
ncbi:GTP-binding protein TypA [candidate division WOR-1 bacterium RIFOXYA12_FULL_52_29]|uniref:Large ribosomal subunit assembly factor BipA n=1 Tax=candidate division WOR-1 bacterium RIFOXYC12_FULL_54_18 TaxID=1802584 RepID=A0A1F4T692_UNCSA|nr:MAG: GTP-binding protein TypA [candidate division WOR-1 bacterium RIFOXYA2_FULL_51_19]OGC17653.1 MAG: GTP-binding protein TypA [candidate division WOR-1 bacterium RIFOXYA12_FULL_52_29]OGC26510.1 MAG: GTP-binding protein TypA [candidate division WOR-1 bacterium RIFOXYB2_FULL_45_9]OGC28070.1 MAG: GTP-binding protein TypA [candidate division WOR-1 bacterium RIFOXYC12_FULL_54_18]OGC29644.1 MAG: GTP-binding protein TypA [candidate division WOR-1 bacterium RIFOXYB12_FULL_52_16]